MFHCLLDQSVVNHAIDDGSVVCQPVSTLKAGILNITMIATLKINMSKWQHCKFDNWR